MKKLLLLLLTVVCLNYIQAPVFADVHTHGEHKEKVDYKKYGRIATVVVKEDYPEEEVVDYQYAGRRMISENEVIDTFIFQVKEDGKDLTVLVKVTHRLDDSKFLNLTVEEQERK
ncbi:DUF3889 domain-containing protein [Cytobacillus sp. FSL W7-1323]|uniref:DUF3889 domain-containing protein n=1 Tax=Cytobacillus kochii TaxID=859143 RepID=A0A248TDU0_9BACI|nr:MULTISPECIES: DUF3889 domain-containing protein [Cytobacillus]ASV66375.1 hypothetical protein CKF48_02890 [Cytobacillus kochii]MEA1851502.1 DUF3889 domain-containing protein [Cytobacillus sp. OWB-43]MED1605571.1 DUF3889 domain-containing protein [Cytobacillus kochii]